MTRKEQQKRASRAAQRAEYRAKKRDIEEARKEAVREKIKQRLRGGVPRHVVCGTVEKAQEFKAAVAAAIKSMDRSRAEVMEQALAKLNSLWGVTE